MGFTFPVLCTIGICSASLGCSSSQSSTSTASFQTAPCRSFLTDKGVFSVSLWTAPEQPPARGVNRVKLEVSDTATGALADGLSVAIVPWMPAMGHGTSEVPTVLEQGSGIYIASNVNFFMPASWQLRMAFSTNEDGSTGVTDSAYPTFDVP